jgi:hypothetical protein
LAAFHLLLSRAMAVVLVSRIIWRRRRREESSEFHEYKKNKIKARPTLRDTNVCGVERAEWALVVALLHWQLWLRAPLDFL